MNKVLGALLVIAALPVLAGEAVDDSDLPQWTVDRITPLHDRVSRWVSNTSRNIDGFFGTDAHLHTSNRSYIRLTQEMEWEEGQGLSVDPGIRFKLDLPTTRERLRLIIESDPEETQGTLAEQGSQRLRGDSQTAGDTVVGLSRLTDRDWKQHWDTRFSAGIKVRLPLDPYLRWDAKRLWDLGDGPWMLASENRLSWFNSDGYFARTRWDLGRPLDERRHLRLVTNVQWQEDEDTLEFSEMAALDRILGSRSAIRYAAVVVGNSASNPRINDYYLQALYRRNLHREILFADVIPELHFHRDTGHQPRWGLTLRLEMFFMGDVIKR